MRPFCSPLSLLALLVIAGCGGQAPEPPSSAPPRHLIWISLDTTRADHFGFLGNGDVQTPNLDALAAESIVLEDHMGVAPTTLASHVSMMTGNYPHTHGVPRNGFKLSPDNDMLAELLARNGFRTAGFIGSFALESRFDFAQGFDDFDEDFDRFAGQSGRLQNERTAAAVNQAVFDYLDRDGLPERLFLFLHYFDPHAPYEAPAPFDTLYDPAGREGLVEWKQIRERPPEQLDAETVRRLQAQYAGEISYLDAQLGLLIDRLRSQGILDDALLVLTSDHGETFVEHGAPEFFDHGWLTAQTTIRSLGLLRLPGGEGRRVQAPTSSIDLFPTVLDQLGMDVPDGIDGQRLQLEPGQTPIDANRLRFAQATKPWEAEEPSTWLNLSKERAVRDGTLKLVQRPYLRQESLFDLASDPGEQRDLLRGTLDAGLTERVNRMRRELELWAHSGRPLHSRFEDSQRRETLERLCALGYVDNCQDVDRPREEW